MKSFCRAVSALKDELGTLCAAGNPPEMKDRLIELLSNLLTAVESGNHRLTAAHVDVLREFWLNHIPWCAALSKQVEKLLILHEEEATEKNGSHFPPEHP